MVVWTVVKVILKIIDIAGFIKFGTEKFDDIFHTDVFAAIQSELQEADPLASLPESFPIYLPYTKIGLDLMDPTSFLIPPLQKITLKAAYAVEVSTDFLFDWMKFDIDFTAGIKRYNETTEQFETGNAMQLYDIVGDFYTIRILNLFRKMLMKLGFKKAVKALFAIFSKQRAKSKLQEQNAELANLILATRNGQAIVDLQQFLSDEHKKITYKPYG